MLESFIKYLGEAIVLVKDGDIHYVNPAAAGLLGPLFSREDLDLGQILPVSGGLKYSQCSVYNKTYMVSAWDAGEVFALCFSLPGGMELEALSAVANGLRQPISAMYNSLQRLYQSDTGARESNQPSIGTLTRNLYRLLRIMLNIDCIVKCEKGEPCEALSIVNINELINKIAEECRPYAASFGCDISVECAGNISLLGYPSKISQAVYNLVGNAFEHGGKGGHVRIKALRVGKQVSVSVSDTGDGIDLSSLYRMADVRSFYSADGLIGNTAGVGLAMVKSTAKLHNGTLMVESSRGTTVTFTLSDVEATEDMLNSSMFDSPDQQWIRPEILLSPVLSDRDYLDQLS